MNPFASFFRKDILLHPLTLAAFGVVGLIAVGSVFYYVSSTRSPSAVWASPTVASITEVVTSTGTVEPAQNPDLAFASGGRVASVNVAVGDAVGEGQTLASLDTSTLSAQRDQAEANLAAQQADLDQMQAGPRAVDVAAKQTALDQANTTLSNLYASIPANIAQAYDKSFSGTSAATDNLFSQPNSPNATLAFQTTDSQMAANAATQRASVNNELTTWDTETSALSSTAATAQIDTALQTSLNHLAVVRDYCDTILTALTNAIPSTTFSAAQLASAQAAVGALRDSTNTTIISLQALQQQIQTDELAVQSAQDALNQTNAGSTPQDIEAQQAAVAAAQANIANVDAQIANDIITAPYSGTVTSVAVKAGQIVTPNTVAVSLTPHSALQVVAYLTEVDVAKLKVGDAAAVTLDAYGNGRIFPAKVVSLDQSPTMQNGIPSYKVTLQFQHDDPAISSGMTANVSITAAQKDNALTIPKTALVQNGNSDFVLVRSGNTSVQREVTTGLEGTDTVEIMSGLSTDDQILVNTK